VPATVSTALMLVSAAGMVPYFCSAILALLAMLKHGPISMGAAIIAFQLTLWEFLMTLQLIWMGTKFYWETTMNQEPPQELNPSMEKPKVHEKSKENLQANPSNSSTSV
jgi:formate hydrogenlyase subunit 3/multisubunit Na+/H+ antiporter MnhD subunit